MLALHSRQDEGRISLADERAVGNGAEGEVRAKVSGSRVGEGEGGDKGRSGGEAEHFACDLFFDREDYWCLL